MKPIVPDHLLRRCYSNCTNAIEEKVVCYCKAVHDTMEPFRTYWMGSNCEQLWRNNLPCRKSDVRLLAEGRNQVPRNWWKSDKMAAKTSKKTPRMGNAKQNRNLEKTQGYITPTLPWAHAPMEISVGTLRIAHVPWNSQSLGIKAASDLTRPSLPAKTLPQTHRFCHSWTRLHGFLSLFQSLILSLLDVESVEQN